jgi:peptidoglycan-associated lipoprotein
MSRFWMVSLVILVLALTVVACGPKPQPTPPPPPVIEETPPPPPKVEPPPAPSTDQDKQEKPWYTDLSVKALNDQAVSRGFYPNIYFDLDKSDLREDAREKLAANARFLRENAELKATVEGHCDERGTEDYNLALGDRRANTARDYLTSLDVSGSRMRTISYGEERPVCTESTEGCWQRNRRAYFVLGF